MKKIVAIVLVLVTLISAGNVSAFALTGNNNELNQEKYASKKSRKHISEEMRKNVKREFIKIKKQNPEFTKERICEIVSKKFNISVSTVKRCSLRTKDYEHYREYTKQYNEKNKEKRKKYYKQHSEEDNELNKIQILIELIKSLQ